MTAYILVPSLTEMLLGLVLNPGVFPRRKDVTGSAWIEVNRELRTPYCLISDRRVYHYSWV